METKRLSRQAIERRWLTNRPTHVERLEAPPRPLSELPQRQADARASFTDAMKFLETLGDARRLPDEFRRALADEMISRAKLHLATFGISCILEHDDDESYLVLHGGLSSTQPLSRFISSWDRHGVTVAYHPALLMKRGFGAFARGTALLGIGHDDVLAGHARGVSVAHESVHIDTKLDTRKGRPSPYTGDLNARGKRALLPGHLEGGYGARQSIEELRTHARDLRQMVRELRRDLPSLSVTERAKKHRYLTNRMRNALQIALRTGAAISQAASRLAQGSADVDYRSSFADGQVWAKVDVVTRRAPLGYVVTVPLVGSKGPDDPRNGELLRDQLAWTRNVCRGHLSLFRIATQCHDALMRGDLASATAVADALIDVLAQHGFDTAPGITPMSYDALVDRFNARLEGYSTSHNPR